ncbi:MAG: Rieske (2Fe-2S) protein [Microthrixaceae bacterium]
MITAPSNAPVHPSCWCAARTAVRAFYNSCRHRGAPVVREACGTSKRLTCQYHSWSYGLDGELRAVPDERSFSGLDTDSLGLVPVRCETGRAGSS